jgi:hypothetical protein
VDFILEMTPVFAQHVRKEHLILGRAPAVAHYVRQPNLMNLRAKSPTMLVQPVQLENSTNNIQLTQNVKIVPSMEKGR